MAKRRAQEESYEDRFLKKFLRHPNLKKQKEAVGVYFKHPIWWFVRSIEKKLGDYEDLIEAFVKSEAFKSNPSALVFALNETTSKIPKTACKVCEYFLNRIDEYKIKDISNHLNFDFYIIPQIVVRAYSQNIDNPDISKRCLDLIDKLMQLGESQGINKALKLLNS